MYSVRTLFEVHIVKIGEYVKVFKVFCLTDNLDNILISANSPSEVDGFRRAYRAFK